MRQEIARLIENFQKSKTISANCRHKIKYTEKNLKNMKIKTWESMTIYKKNKTNLTIYKWISPKNIKKSNKQCKIISRWNIDTKKH